MGSSLWSCTRPAPVRCRPLPTPGRVSTCSRLTFSGGSSVTPRTKGSGAVRCVRQAGGAMTRVPGAGGAGAGGAGGMGAGAADSAAASAWGSAQGWGLGCSRRYGACSQSEAHPPVMLVALC